MRYRKAIFAVVYSREGGEIKYLVLHRKLHWKGWEFCKGGVEEKEKLIEAAKREAKEETGQKIINIKDYPISGKYKYEKILNDRPGVIGQTYNLFGVEVKRGKVKMDKKEHDKYKWLSFKEAKKILTWENQKKCLEVVNRYLTSN